MQYIDWPDHGKLKQYVHSGTLLKDIKNTSVLRTLYVPNMLLNINLPLK